MHFNSEVEIFFAWNDMGGAASELQTHPLNNSIRTNRVHKSCVISPVSNKLCQT